MNKITLVLALFLVSFSGNAQIQKTKNIPQKTPQEIKELLMPSSPTDYALRLKSGTRLPEENRSIEQMAGLKNVAFEGKKYLMLQFYNIPDANRHAEIRACGIDLLGYIPNNTYWAAMPDNIDENTLEQLGVRSVIIPKIEDKISPALLGESMPAHIIESKDNIKIIIVLHDNIQPVKVWEQLNRFNAKNTKETSLNTKQMFPMTIRQTALKELASLPFVAYVEPIEQVGELLQSGTRSNAVRADYVRHPLNGADALSGQGVIVLNADGMPGHIDLRDRIINTPPNWSEDDSHGNPTSGMIAGMGILNPQFHGVAPGADLLIDNINDYDEVATEYIPYDNLIAQYIPDGLATATWILGTNADYGEYNSYSQFYDDQLNNFEEILHVPSAGNFGEGGFNTINKGRQSAKNALTVGATDQFNNIWAGSSRGPTLDGRIKPEIVAIGAGVLSPSINQTYVSEAGTGFYGTSYSGPQVAGGLALLYEHYRNLNNNNNPKGALMKAIACNTADDLGNPGPDYTFGFGKLNLRRARDVISNNQFFSGSVTQNGAGVHPITVGANVHELKIMLYWSDPSAEPSASTTLKNDLNLFVGHNQSGNSYLPYILDENNPALSATISTSIGEDFKNNVEQIVIKNPAPGDYNIFALGGTIGSGTSQDYHVVYELVQAGVTITSPYEGDDIQGHGPNYYIQWDYYGDDINTFTIEYSLDGGGSWAVIQDDLSNSDNNIIIEGDKIPADARTFRWQAEYLKNINSDEVMVKVIRNVVLHEDISGDHTENRIFNKVEDDEISVSVHCQDVVEIVWNPAWLTDYPAQSFEVLAYDETASDMLVIATTTATSYLLPYDFSNGEGWFSIRAVYPDGKSVRSNAVRLSLPLIAPDCSMPCPEYVELNYDTDSGTEHPQTALVALSDAQTSGNWILTDGQLKIWVRKLPISPISSWNLDELSIQITDPAGNTFTPVNGITEELNNYVYIVTYDIPNVTFNDNTADWTVEFADTNPASGGYEIAHTRISYLPVEVLADNAVVVADQDIYVQTSAFDQFYIISPTVQGNSLLSNVTLEIAFQPLDNSCEDEIEFLVLDPLNNQTTYIPFPQTPCTLNTQGFLISTTSLDDYIVPSGGSATWRIFFKDNNIPAPGGNQYRIGFARITYDEINLACTNGPIDSPTSTPIGETGQVANYQTTPNTWFTVDLNNTYNDPVVVMGPPSRAGVSPATVRVRNITSNSFEYQVDEWDYLDGIHYTETVSYMVVESGQHTLDNGQVIVAGKRNDMTHAWKTQSLGIDFTAVPVVLSQTATANEDAAVTIRQRNITPTQFQMKLQEQESNNGTPDAAHLAETVCWIAIGDTQGDDFETGITPQSVRHLWYDLQFKQSYTSTPVFIASTQSTIGGDPIALRYRNLNPSDVDIICEEEKSKNNEVGHVYEIVGYYAGEAGNIYGSTFEQSTAPIQRLVMPVIPEDEVKQMTVNVYPNPVTDQLTIDIETGTTIQETYQISVLDLSGKTLISREELVGNSHQLNLSLGALPSGMYIIRLDNLNTHTYSTHKVIKN